MNRPTPSCRARRASWACVVIAVALTGGLSAAPGPAAAVAVAGLGLLLAVVLAVAVRLMLGLAGRLVSRSGPALDPTGQPSRHATRCLHEVARVRARHHQQRAPGAP